MREKVGLFDGSYNGHWHEKMSSVVVHTTKTQIIQHCRTVSYRTVILGLLIFLLMEHWMCCQPKAPSEDLSDCKDLGLQFTLNLQGSFTWMVYWVASILGTRVSCNSSSSKDLLLVFKKNTWFDVESGFLSLNKSSVLRVYSSCTYVYEYNFTAVRQNVRQLKLLIREFQVESEFCLRIWT